MISRLQLKNCDLRVSVTNVKPHQHAVGSRRYGHVTNRLLQQTAVTNMDAEEEQEWAELVAEKKKKKKYYVPKSQNDPHAGQEKPGTLVELFLCYPGALQQTL